MIQINVCGTASTINPPQREPSPFQDAAIPPDTSKYRKTDTAQKKNITKLVTNNYGK
jgi:hypothetical protein